MSKRLELIKSKINKATAYSAQEAIELLKDCSAVKFDEAVDVAVVLGVDPRKSDQVVRGATLLPNGTGRTVRVAVFAQGANAEAALSAGADIVGYEDLAEKIQAAGKSGGKLDFDVLIATPDAMRLIGPLGRILGPKGLMPNPKVGTVTPDVAKAVQNAKAGQVSYRTDKAGIIHCTIGKCSFGAEALIENLNAIIRDLRKAKPSTSKGIYLKKIVVSSTMGPGLTVENSSLSAAL